MERVELVGLGLATLDVLVRLREMPSWHGCSHFNDIRLDGGGCVGTAMVAAARLGASAGFVGTAGNDEFAERKLRSFVEDGVDLSRLLTLDAPEDQLVLCYVNEDTGEREFSVKAGFLKRTLAPGELDREYLTSARYLLLDGSHFDAALRAAQWMRDAGKSVVLDGSKADGPVSPAMRTLVEHTDVLICASGFAPGLTGVNDVVGSGRAVLDLGPGIVVQTDGEKGCDTITAEEAFHTPAFAVDVVDTTGAGDVFHGAYLVGLLRGWDLHATALFASAVAAIKCTRMGGRAGIPILDETTAFLRARGWDIPS
ncbi:carbohydrate kinase family protein [Verrucomicrobiota bacterium]